MVKRQDSDRSKLPNELVIYWSKYYYETWYCDEWFKSRNYKCKSDYNLFYIDYKNKKRLIDIWWNNRDDCIEKMFKQLKNNNYVTC